MKSPRSVREMLKTLARLAGERADYAIRAAADQTSRESSWSLDASPAQATVEDARTRARADTARYLLTEAWVAAGCDDAGRWWISREDAEALTDAMIQIVLAQRSAPSLSRMDLDDVFTGSIEVS